MTAQAPQRRPLSLQTLQMQQSRFWGMIGLLIFLGPPAVVCAVFLRGFALRSQNKRGLFWLAIAGIVGAVIVALAWPIIRSELEAIRAILKLALAKVPKGAPTIPASVRWTTAVTAWPMIRRLWLEGLLLAPFAALFIEASRVKTAEELERMRDEREQRQRRTKAAAARELTKKAPVSTNNEMVFGAPIAGDLKWTRGEWFTYPPAVLGRHLVVIGGSGTGKTETSIRLAYGAAKAYGWRVLFLDCKGDEDMAQRFMDAMHTAGRKTAALFPGQPYDGWRGDATAILNRLLTIIDYTEPYYRDLTKMILDLAVHAPPGPPRSSTELLERINLDNLLMLYNGRPEANELVGMKAEHIHSAYNRYRAFYRALKGGLDGAWAFEDVEAGYVLLNGLELKDQTVSIGRFMIEDFAHFVSARKDPNDRVLFIIDEFPAIAFGGANTATLFEMVRSRGAGVVVTAQSYAGMGEDVERILGAAAGLVLHQCADPDKLLPRAGMVKNYQRRVSFAERGVGAAPKGYALGEGSLGAQEELKIHPNHVKELQPGECFVISGGTYQHVSVSRVRMDSAGEKPVNVQPAPAVILQGQPLLIEVAHSRRRNSLVAPSADIIPISAARTPTAAQDAPGPAGSRDELTHTAQAEERPAQVSNIIEEF